MKVKLRLILLAVFRDASQPGEDKEGERVTDYKSTAVYAFNLKFWVIGTHSKFLWV